MVFNNKGFLYLINTKTGFRHTALFCKPQRHLFFLSYMFLFTSILLCLSTDQNCFYPCFTVDQLYLKRDDYCKYQSYEEHVECNSLLSIFRKILMKWSICHFNLVSKNKINEEITCFYFLYFYFYFFVGMMKGYICFWRRKSNNGFLQKIQCF